LTPARFGFFGGEYLTRISNSINMIFADIAGMCLPEELRSGILAGRKTRLPEKSRNAAARFPHGRFAFFPFALAIKRHIRVSRLLPGEWICHCAYQLGSEEAGERSVFGLNRTTRSGDG